MSRSLQACPQCTGVLQVHAVDALVCPHCGAIATVDGHGSLTVPDQEQLDQLLLRPEVRKVIEQASAIRQALFGGRFTLADPTGLLDPEPHNTLADAVARGALPPWTVTVWIVVDPSGRVAAHRGRRKQPPPERTA